jgi:ABC-type branched-subunit amino acid transport system ATPase component
VSALLSAEGLRVTYGGVRALDGVDLDLSSGHLIALVGANGAGKSTLLDCLSGHLRPDEGVVRYQGHDVTALGPDRRARLGLIRSFQDARLFPTLSVRDALLLAQERSMPTRILPALLTLPPWRAAERRRLSSALAVCDRLGLSSYVDQRVGELSTGVRRVVDLACAIALQPRLLLLDEPSAGLASAEAAAVPGLLRQVHDDTGATIVLVEHDLPLVWGLADRIVVMEEGRIVADGRPSEVRDHPAVSFGAEA